jgi:hypothetical protein
LVVFFTSYMKNELQIQQRKDTPANSLATQNMALKTVKPTCYEQGDLGSFERTSIGVSSEAMQLCNHSPQNEGLEKLDIPVE